ncbi:VOC family protein [Maribacter algarum]|uniref:VOC family protein n=1 Tax=Maribacter algarum (ex Zhang et al. 2020) TaxID=2578118 RepID=A0A5S3PSE1_9FLAO|nr:VOC family protein [Maribacter algarum]TMM57909.1 VOC family protein [Maribacter algarum]
MLVAPTITAFLPTAKPKESKQFYWHTLGLKLRSEDPYAFEFEGNGLVLRITIVNEFTPQPFTVLGFRIDKIESQVKTLQEKGVEFEKYGGLQQDDLGIWTSPSKAKIAWFKDPDGNLISLTEYENE